MSRALAAAPLVLLPLALVLAAAGAGVEWYVYTVSFSGDSVTASWGLLSYRYQFCSQGACAATTFVYTAMDLPPELKAIVASAFVIWLGCVLLLIAAVASGVAAYRKGCSLVAGAVVGWFGSLLLLVGLALSAANFSAFFKKTFGEPPSKTGAGAPLVGIGFVLAIVSSVLLSAAARAGAGAGRAAFMLKSSQQQQVIDIIPSPYAAPRTAAPGLQQQQQQHIVVPSPFATPGAPHFLTAQGVVGSASQRAVLAPGAGAGMMAMPPPMAAPGGDKPLLGH